MATVAVLNPRHTLFRTRVNQYPRALLIVGALTLLAPVLHVSSSESSDDLYPLPFLGSTGSSWVENAYWLAAVVVAGLVSVVQYRKHEVVLRGMVFTMAVALGVYIFVAVMPGAVWHWRYLGLIGLAAVVWALVIAERSLWLGMVATGFTAVSVVSGTTDSAFYRDMGLFTDYSGSGLREVLLPALVALIGGAVGLVSHKPVDDERALVLLNDLARLSRPADARRYAPPLLAFSVLIIAATALYRPSTRVELVRWKPELVYGFGGTGYGFTQPWLIDLYWLGVVVVGLGFAMWWYRVRAARQGVELRTRGLLVAAGAVLLGILVGVPVVYSVLGGYTTGYLDPYLHVWLLVLSVLVAAAVLLWSAKVAQRRASRAAGLVAGWLVASFAVAMLAMYLDYWVLLVIAAVVVAMAWVERSQLLAVVATLFTTVVVLTSVTENSLFRVIGWGVDGHRQLDVLQDLLLPAAVLLLGGLAGLAGLATRVLGGRRVRND